MDEEAFLESLEMVATCCPPDDFTIPRAAQLTQRSNQFNLRTVRYSESDLRHYAEDPNVIQLYFTLADRFGPHGLVSVLIGKVEGNALFLDTWLMSCRVLKRSLEDFALNKIVLAARAVAKTWPEGKIEGDRFVLSGYIAHTGTMMLRRSAYQEAARRWEIFNWHFALGDKQIQLAMSRLGDIWCSHDVVSVYRIQTSGAMRTNGDRVHRDGGLVSLFFESVGASPSIKRMERFRFHVLKYRARIASRMPWKVRMVEVDALAKFGLLPIFDLFMVRLGRPYLMLWYIRKKVKGLGYRLSRVTHA